MTRREYLRLQVCGGTGIAIGTVGGLGCSRTTGLETAARMIVLGLDGMDPQITARMMREGKLPNFEWLARQGHFGPLGTSTPPQSPVAWSNFITGCNPGMHGIFDFIHRHPETYLPYLSTSRTEAGARTITVGDYVVPLSSGKIENLRHGHAFWEILEDHDVPATIYKIPSNFPPSETRQKTLSGLGTPDILGTYGTFSFFTDDPWVMLDPDLGGGRVQIVELRNNSFQDRLIGPPNSFRKDALDSGLDFTVYRDSLNPAIMIEIGDRKLILNEGEWSDWLHISYPLIPAFGVKGICRFHLQQAYPIFKLYVTPVHIDPADPILPISTPCGYSEELCAALGPFHTKGLPADTKALDQGILSEAEFIAQDEAHLEETIAAFDYELARFDSGLLFFYVSNVDQRSHMFWRLTDPQHPAYDHKLAKDYGGVIEDTYRQMDRLVGKALTKVDRHTILMVLSDHGFHPYYRSFHLNSWLESCGYLRVKDNRKRDDSEGLGNVDWSRTRAYAFGLNGLCINQMGREGQGIVAPSDKQALVDDIATQLRQTLDPITGDHPVLEAASADRCYSGPYTALAPDLVVGYDSGYRVSWQTALGKIPNDVFATNNKKWSGDHCMAPSVSPGIILLNRPIQNLNPNLSDLTATILQAFAIRTPVYMQGRPLLRRS